jgi:uncharacterized repeat protein (TIGR01451 family)
MNLYEGFQFVHNGKITLNIGNFRVPDDVSKATGLLGHITWEGDDTLASDNEGLLFNGYELSDKVNNSGNQFNSASTVNDDTNSYGIDFDAYVIQNKGNRKPFVAGATTATTTYQTDDDLVLLSAEIVAVPNVQTADLKMLMTRVGNLQVGANATYTVTVSNLGPNQDDGPITVTDTMPAGMSQPSGSGSGWSCSTSGQKVTCTNTGPLAAGASLPPITFTANVSTAGTYTNTATVAGAEFDNVSFNNTVSDTATTIAQAQGAYVFTDGACTAGVPLGSAGQCKLYSAPLFAGDVGSIYVTAVNSSRVPTALGTTAQNVSLSFALGCENPAAHAGRMASYAGVSLPLCSPKGSAPGSTGWSTLTMAFPANQPSASLAGGFVYEDVGSVVLNLRDSVGNAASTSFVVKPAVIDFADIWRPRGPVSNPNGSYGFAMAGEAFSIAVQACTYATDPGGNPKCGKSLPNFGNEGQGVSITQQQSPGDPLFVPSTSNALASGVITGTGFHVDDVGIVKLVLRMFPSDYLGAGEVKDVVPPRTVGRFYPAYFTTVVTPKITPCLTKMNCTPTPSTAGELMQGAVYSGQPFTVKISAFNTSGKLLANYRGTFARDIQLSAASVPGGSSLLPAQSGIFAPAKVFASQVAPETTVVDATFKLPSAYSNASPPSTTVSGPTPFFLRATSIEELPAAAFETISSQRPADSSEQGVTVINGRLQLANAFGSELLKLPMPMKAQYWTGAAWENNANDNASAIAYKANTVPPIFSKCTRRLAKDSAGTCSDALALRGGPDVPLNNGAGTLWLAAPGNGNVGSGLLDLTGRGSPPWLPSTLARVTFGIYQSPLIYIREVY